jgi:hypothetical protein
MGSKRGITESLSSLARLAAASGEPERAAPLLGVAEALFEEIGIRMDPNDRMEFDHSLAATRSRLGEEAFTAAWEQGRAMTVEQAIAYALGGAE